MVIAPSSRRRGYTILELVLVLAILAMAMAAVAPSLTGFIAGRKPEETAARFLALTRYARSQAITEGVEYQLVVNPGEGKWWLRMLEDDQPREVPGAFGKVYEAPEGVRVEADLPASNGEQTLHFDPSGRSEVGTVKFIGLKSETDVVCDAAFQGYRTMPGGEVRP